MIDPTHLRSLREVDARGTVTAAAAALGYTTSAISQQLKALAVEVDADVLRRDGRGVRLTRAGRALLTHADDILERLEHARAVVAADSSARIAGRIDLAAFPSSTRHLVAPAVAAAAREHPHLQASVRTMETEASLPALRAGSVEVAVAHEYDLLPTETSAWLHRRPLLEEPVLLLAPPGELPAGPIELAALAGGRWIAGPEGSTCGEAMRRACNAAGFVPSVDHVTADFAVTASLVAAGCGVALLPELALDHNVDVDARPLAGRPLMRRVFVATKAGAQHDPRVDALLTRLHHVAARHPRHAMHPASS